MKFKIPPKANIILRILANYIVYCGAAIPLAWLFIVERFKKSIDLFDKIWISSLGVIVLVIIIYLLPKKNRKIFYFLSLVSIVIVAYSTFLLFGKVSKNHPQPPKSVVQESIFTIKIVTYPLDANVYIDEQLYGTSTPLIVKLPKGSHNIVVSKSGYKEYRMKLDIREDKLMPITLEQE